MNCLCWNCRELGNSRRIRELHHLVRTKCPTLVFLIETKISRAKAVKVRNIIGFYQSFVVESRGSSGGLAFLWSSHLQVELMSYTQNHISVKMFLNNLGKNCLITGFNGDLVTAKRVDSWRLLRALKPPSHTA